MAQGQLNRAIRHIRRLLGAPPGGASSDRQLLERYAQDGMEEAFEQLVVRHGAMVLGVCRRVLRHEQDAEDAFQATFLVLARKAGALGWRESIGGWLYEVACRTSAKLRGQAVRRRSQELTATAEPAAPPESVPCQEIHAVLDDELLRLPPKLRMPVVLCCLQDQTVDEAARSLGVAPTTLKGRLQQGRELLRRRLGRRGLTLSIGVLGTLLGEESASAVPPVLLRTTVQAAAGSGVSAAVTALAQGVVQAMFWAKLKTVFVSVCVLGMVTSVSALIVWGVGAHFQAAALVPVPKDVPARAKEQVKPSEPVVQDGLAVTVAPTKAVFAADEVPTFEFTYSNRRDKPFRLYDVGYEVNHFLCTTGQEKFPWQAGPWEYAARPAPRIVQVDPGKSFVQSHTLRGPFRWRGFQARPVAPRAVLAPGKYRLTANIRFGSVDANHPVAFWEGELNTKPVEFEIAAARTSAPATKDGLTVTVGLTQAVYAEKDPLSLLLTLQNTSDQPLALYKERYPSTANCQVSVRDRKTGKSRRLAYQEPVPGLPPPTPADSQVLKPQETLEAKFPLRGFGAGFFFYTDNPLGEPALLPLPPGQYSLSVEVVYRANPTLKGPPPRQWTGTLPSQALDFEIVAETGK